MLDSIIKFSIKNKLVIGIMTLLLIIWGVWSATKLPIDAVPDITNNGSYRKFGGGEVFKHTISLLYIGRMWCLLHRE
ncbi:hypothetical protein, partial [Sphingobacterium sp. HSC-15S19]|uniref:hypothetical protein n=1 Tax=Sphingobacterium sp. HSC-15S19 TaxID=2910971 RepID=UPI003D1D9717